MYGLSERQAEEASELLREQRRQGLLALPQHDLYYAYTQATGLPPDFSLSNEELVEQILGERREG